MRLRNVDLEFADLVKTDSGDGEELDLSEGDGIALDKFLGTLADIESGINRDSLTEQTADSDAALTKHYAALAASVAAPAETKADPQQLEKRAGERIEVEMRSDGRKIEKTFGRPSGDLLRIRILEEGDE